MKGKPQKSENIFWSTYHAELIYRHIYIYMEIQLDFILILFAHKTDKFFELEFVFNAYIGN